MSPPIDVPRKMARRNAERGHHFDHVAGVDPAAGSFSGWDRGPTGRGRERRGRSPVGPMPAMMRRNILEILRIAGQAVQADDRKPALFARGRIVAGEEGQAVAGRPASFGIVGAWSWLRSAGCRASRRPALPRSELVADGEEDLPRIAVEGGQHAFAAERRDQACGQGRLGSDVRWLTDRRCTDSAAGSCSRRSYISCRSGSCRAGRSSSGRPAARRRCWRPAARSPSGRCPGVRDFELLALAAIGQSVELRLSVPAGQRRGVVERAARRPFRRVLDLRGSRPRRLRSAGSARRFHRGSRASGIP